MAQVWKIAPGEHADHWEMCRDRNCILIGWRALRDYRKFKSEKAILRALGGGPGDGSGAARSIWRFTNEVKPFDIVVAGCHWRRRDMTVVGETTIPLNRTTCYQTLRVPLARPVCLWYSHQSGDMPTAYRGDRRGSSKARQARARTGAGPTNSPLMLPPSAVVDQRRLTNSIQSAYRSNS
jgi:hypothetical protein